MATKLDLVALNNLLAQVDNHAIGSLEQMRAAGSVCYPGMLKLFYMQAGTFLITDSRHAVSQCELRAIAELSIAKANIAQLIPPPDGVMTGERCYTDLVQSISNALESLKRFTREAVKIEGVQLPG